MIGSFVVRDDGGEGAAKQIDLRVTLLGRQLKWDT